MTPKLPYSDIDGIGRKLAAIHGIADLQRFTTPDSQELHSPYLLKNIEKAAKEIYIAIKNKMKIVIHIDIDNDGVTSGTLMYSNLKKFTDNVFYIHSQRSEGHSIDVTEDKIPDDTDLLIIIDSSTNSVEACKRITNNNIKVIVIDHHEQDLMNPYCTLVNPQQKGCEYPNKLISAAVVAWKVCQVLDEYFKTSHSEDYYDVVAIGLTGDVMSLMEYENRYIVYKGLSMKNEGIKSLLSEMKKDLNGLSSSDISYSISPCINAACRMDKIEVVIELLIETDPKKAKVLAKQVIAMNEERKKIQAKYVEELRPLIDDKDKCSIIINNEIGKGFKGLVAGEFCNELQKAIMVLSEDENDTYSGSYRAYNDFDLRSFLNSIPEVEYAAGHASVGGVRFKRCDLDKVQRYLNENLQAINNELEYIMEFDIEELNEGLIKKIESFYRISGKGFETGRFLISNIRPQKKDVLGKDRNTVKIPCTPMSRSYFYDDDELLKMTPSLSLMKFRTNEHYFSEEIMGKEIKAIGTLNFNEFKGFKGKVSKSSQLFLEDYRVVN
ncbi:DHH family phosphoesterase [Paenibacillus sp. N1-5-1-14]|uniref:DHH family phosphoesterase n=1 Tax=Paenibacillus radicibacter TaxID=2972488 RepID=UPI002158D0DE|nr:DHH family phosphoesterase [Paenibacillus radicibacter]MCR8641395.1 DHH family phosphoesterase [Paenibacillus radicibacter]